MSKFNRWIVTAEARTDDEPARRRSDDGRALGGNAKQLRELHICVVKPDWLDGVGPQA